MKPKVKQQKEVPTQPIKTKEVITFKTRAIVCHGKYVSASKLSGLRKY